MATISSRYSFTMCCSKMVSLGPFVVLNHGAAGTRLFQDLPLVFCRSKAIRSHKWRPLRAELGIVFSFLSSLSFSPSCFSMDTPPPGYRRNVGICLINACSKIFAASRIDIPDAWQMPQGGIDEGEDPRDAAVREMREETGIISADIVAEIPNWLIYEFPATIKEKLSKQWGTNWTGQAQKWFLARFNGREEEINLSGDGTEKPEFADWAWMEPRQILELAVDFKRPVYEEVLKAFESYFHSDPAEKK